MTLPNFRVKPHVPPGTLMWVITRTTFRRLVLLSNSSLIWGEIIFESQPQAIPSTLIYHQQHYCCEDP